MNLASIEITPQDQYQIRIIQSIEMSHVSYLIHLYQPIIGSDAVSLYLTLRNHLSFQYLGVSKLQAHRQLATKMFQPFHNIMKARKALEAIGLLRTKKFQHPVDEDMFIEYILIPPLQPIQFFQSDILSILLLNRIGKTSFHTLMEQLLPNEEKDTKTEYIEKEITKAFDEVFDSVLLSELTMSSGSEAAQIIQPYSIQTEDNLMKNKITIKDQYLDLEFIKGMVSNLFKVEQILTKDTIPLLNELAFLYQLSEMDIIHLLHDQFIYSSSGDIDENRLRQRIKEKLYVEQKEMLLVNKEEEKNNTKVEPPIENDKEKRHRWILEHYSPVQLLKQYQGGAKIPEADLSLVEGLVRDFQLPFQVVNVLIEYILLSNQYKLPKKLTEKIAGHWKRIKISTVDEALKIAKKEHQLYKGWLEGNKKGTTSQGRTSSKQKTTEKREKVPEYILNQNQKYHTDQSSKSGEELDQKAQEKIQELLRKLGESEGGAK